MLDQLEQRIGAVVGARPVEWAARSGGYSTAERYTVTLDDGRRVFVKAADAEHMAAWLRREHEVYASLQASFIPKLIGFDDDGRYPVLVIEDLSHADWEPHWTPERVALVCAALDNLHDSPPPPNTRPLRETEASWFGRWHRVEADPEPFLSLGLRSRAWLARRLPEIIETADSAPVDGDAVTHWSGAKGSTREISRCRDFIHLVERSEYPFSGTLAQPSVSYTRRDGRRSKPVRMAA